MALPTVEQLVLKMIFIASASSLDLLATYTFIKETPTKLHKAFLSHRSSIINSEKSKPPKTSETTFVQSKVFFFYKKKTIKKTRSLHIYTSTLHSISLRTLCEHKIKWTSPSSVLFGRINFCFRLQLPRRGIQLFAEKDHQWECGKLMERMSKKMSRVWNMQLLGLAFRQKPKVPENLLPCIRYFYCIFLQNRVDYWAWTSVKYLICNFLVF